MKYIMIVVFVLSAIILFCQDLQYRAVNAWVIVLVFVSLLAKLASVETVAVVLTRVFLNFVVTGITLTGLFAYMKFRSENSSSDEKLSFGQGDVYTLFAATPAFDLFGFLLFLIASGVIILVIWSLLINLKLVKVLLVPYAGSLSALLAIAVVADQFRLSPFSTQSFSIYFLQLSF